MPPRFGAPLPTPHANPLLKNLPPNKLQPVKFQELEKEGRKIIIGRLKIPTPSGHAFILRRYDSGWISLSTMFRAAYPSATDDHEKAESKWVVNNYDIHGITKNMPFARLAGTWVTPGVALNLAESYNIGPIVNIIVEAEPDPEGTYRRSNINKVPETPRITAKPLPTPQTSVDAPSPAKRRREASPALKNDQPKAGTRRSTRSTRNSPAPPSVPASAATEPVKAAKPTSKRQQPLTPAASDEAVGDEEENEKIEKIAVPNMEDDVANQKELIERLKERRAREAQEKKEREAKEKEEREAKEQAEREAKEKEKKEQEVKEKAEREKKAKIEREAKAKAEQEAKEKADADMRRANEAPTRNVNGTSKTTKAPAKVAAEDEAMEVSEEEGDDDVRAAEKEADARFEVEATSEEPLDVEMAQPEQPPQTEEPKAAEPIKEAKAGVKRTREEADEEEPIQFQPKDPAEIPARPIATNSRIMRRYHDVAPENKSFAWGALAFGVAMVATANYLPPAVFNFFPL